MVKDEPADEAVMGTAADSQDAATDMEMSEGAVAAAAAGDPHLCSWHLVLAEVLSTCAHIEDQPECVRFHQPRPQALAQRANCQETRTAMLRRESCQHLLPAPKQVRVPLRSSSQATGTP